VILPRFENAKVLFQTWKYRIHSVTGFTAITTIRDGFEFRKFYST